MKVTVDQPEGCPPTIIVVHGKERASKCTVHPLRGRAGFEFWKHPLRSIPPLGNYVRIGMGGQLLSKADAERGLLVLDGTWHLAGRMAFAVRDVPLRSLPDWKTAYPRKSKTRSDPAGGLATIEALFAAYTILERSTAGLLDGYFWADEFLRLNTDRL